MAGSSSDRVLRPDSGRYDEMANAIRALAIDAVQQANSGHPGAPMAWPKWRWRCGATT